MGRQHSVIPRSSRRSAEGKQILGERVSRYGRMNLATIQRRMARAVMTPLTPDERMRAKAPDGRSLRKVAAEIIKPNDRLTSFERLEIYNRQYWFRILSAFAEDFPGLRAILGERRFDAAAKAYLTDCPSTSFTLRN